MFDHNPKLSNGNHKLYIKIKSCQHKQPMASNFISTYAIYWQNACAPSGAVHEVKVTERFSCDVADRVRR